MFIYEKNINKKICKDLILLYENSDKKEYINEKDVKMTQGVFHISNPNLSDYLKVLNKLIKQYIKKYKHINYGQQPWTIYPNIKIQKYQPNENYGEWHSESTGYRGNNNRLLVFSTFLNTIDQGGETEFFYQKQKIKAEESKTILFPSFWTHTHRGNKTKETKYIITGWCTYVH